MFYFKRIEWREQRADLRCVNTHREDLISLGRIQKSVNQ